MVIETIEYPDGSKYIGDLKDGKPHGKGISTFPDGTMYEGNWVVGKRDGLGIMTYPNRIIYDGLWKNDKKHGKGIMTFPDDTKEELEFNEDEPVIKSMKKKDPFEIDVDF